MRRRLPNDLLLRAKPTESLSLEEMQSRIPAIFAEEAHTSRSDRYVFVSTKQMVEQLVSCDFVPVEASVSKARDDERKAFTKHAIRFRHKQDLTGGGARKVGDTHFEVLLRNAHDGTSSYQFMAGLFRLVCLNGMVVSDGTVGAVHILHKGPREQQLQRVAEGAHNVLKQGPRVIEKVRAWQGIQLNPDERMAFAEGARHVRFADSEGEVATPIKASQLLYARRPVDGGMDLWSTFNVVQENVIRGGLSGVGSNHRRATTREVRGIDGNIKYNKGLWTLAEEMAAYKQAA
jgi:hypothetical protein